MGKNPLIKNTFLGNKRTQKLTCKDPGELQHGKLRKPVTGGPQRDRGLAPL